VAFTASVAPAEARWAISAGGPWRITSEFRDGHAWDAEIVDYQ
jgi:hypothetical protein